MLVLNADDTRRALGMAEAIEAMRWAMSAPSIVPPRIHLDLPDEVGIGLFMPAFVPSSPDEKIPAAYAVKAFSVMRGNAAKSLPAFQGATVILDPQTGACIGLVDAAALTAIRTGASAGVATDLLARSHSSRVGIIGAGPQGAALLEAVCTVRPITSGWIMDHHPEKAQTLANQLTEKGIDMQVVDAIQPCDILCTATPSKHPVFADADIQAGTHINAVGSFRRDMQELPTSSVARARVFVDNLHGARTEPGDILIPIEQGLISADHVLGSLGDLILGKTPGRLTADEITLYKSVGIAVQDAVAGAVAIAAAHRLGIGQHVDW